jgi:hypothetical protein
LFVVSYIGLAVVLSIWISLFWLLAVVAAHFALELARQHLRTPHHPAVLFEAIWELKLDIALVLFAFIIVLYMDTVLALVGLQSAARASGLAQTGLRSGARVAAWQKVLRGALLSVDDAAQLARVAVRRNQAKSGSGSADPDAPSTAAPAGSRWGSWTGPWNTADRIAIGLGLVTLVLLLAAPLLTSHTPSTVLTTLATELDPFPLATPPDSEPPL